MSRVKYALPVIALFSGSSLAQGTNSPPDWLDQAKIVAQLQGIPVGEAVRRAKLQEKVAALDAQYASDPTYGGSYIEQDSKGFRATFRFMGGKRETIADPEVDGVTTFEPAQHSMADVHRERTRLMNAFRQHGIDLAASITPKDKNLLLWPSDAAKAQQLVSNGTIALPEFAVLQSSSLGRIEEANVEGGGIMYGEEVKSTGTVTYNCTGGLVVTNGSVRGIATAGHCSHNPGDLKTHRGRAVGTRMGYVYQQNGLDVSWFRNSAETYLNRIRLSATSYYTVTGVGQYTPPPGTYVCVLKVDDTQKCASVEMMTYYPNNDGPYVTLDQDITDKKDSGGPWFYGGTAYGVHMGTIPYSDKPRSAYSSVGGFSQMGIQVVTQ